MSKKYIGQQTYQNFVYPNNNTAQYDVEIVQNINNNSITGSTSGFTASISGTTLSVSFDYTWNRNGGEVFLTNSNRINLFSVHIMTPDKIYYKPWRLLDYKYITGATPTNYTGSYTASITATELGLTGLTYGEYYFEVRFIGNNNTFIVCENYTITAPPTATPTRTPTPTPSPTPGGPTPTFTPTPTGTATPTPTPSTIGYRPVTMSNPPGANGTVAACALTSGLTYYINNSWAITNGLVIYTNSSLTTRAFNSDPLASGYYLMLYDNINGLRYAINFDSSGNVNTAISC